MDYIVRGGEVELVDEFTGRVAENRRWPDGRESFDIRKRLWATARSSDDVFGANAFLTLAVRPSIGFIGVLVLGPVLFLWALYEHWRQRRKRRVETGREPTP